MFAQFKYALLDIKISKRISMIFFLQMIVVFLLVNSSFVDIVRVDNGLNRLKKLKDNKAYVNGDATSNGKVDALISDSENSIPKLKELYKFIIDNRKTEKYSIWDYTTLESIEGHSIIQATTDKKFFDLYDIKVIEGHLFSQADFSNTQIIPIIVGYNLKDKYRIGKVYIENNLITQEKITYKVIGVLEHNSSYPSLVDVGKEIDLNYTYFKPLNIEVLNDFGSLDMAINSTVIFTNNQNEIHAIEAKSIELGLFSMQYKIIQDRLNEFLGYFEKKMIYQIFLAFIVLLFAAISMTLNLTTMITKRMKEFSIHIICGGTISSIMLRLLWQLLIILSTALIPTILFNGINLCLFYTILLACFISFFVMIIPYIKISTLSLVQIVRRSE